jgi:hypothetical protein
MRRSVQGNAFVGVLQKKKLKMDGNPRQPVFAKQKQPFARVTQSKNKATGVV